MFYKDNKNNLYVDPILENHVGLISITEVEFNELLTIKNTPTQEQLDTRAKLEAHMYLKDTDWVEIYKLRHDLNLEIIPDDSYKWEIISQREVYKEFLKSL